MYIYVYVLWQLVAAASAACSHTVSTHQIETAWAIIIISHHRNHDLTESDQHL